MSLFLAVFHTIFHGFVDFLRISKTVFEDIFSSVFNFFILRSFFFVVGSDLSSFQAAFGTLCKWGFLWLIAVTIIFTFVWSYFHSHLQIVPVCFETLAIDIAVMSAVFLCGLAVETMWDLHSHLLSVRHFLAAFRNNGDFERLRDEQCEGCRQRIRQSNGMDVATSLAAILNDMPFTEHQRSQLQMECNRKLADLPSRGRRPMQNFQDFEGYLTNTLWLAILGDNPVQKALGPLAHHLGLLGLQLPSEKTCSRVTALLLYRSYDGMDRVSKHQVYEHVKIVMKKELAVIPNSELPYTLILPANPSLNDARFLNRAFGKEPRVVCQVNIAQLTFIQQGIPERMSSDCLPSTVSNASSSGSSALEQVVMGAVKNLLGIPKVVKKPELVNLQINPGIWQRQPDSGVEAGQLSLGLPERSGADASHMAYRPAQSGGPGVLAIQDRGIINVGSSSFAQAVADAAPAAENAATPTTEAVEAVQAVADADNAPSKEPIADAEPQPAVPQEKDTCFEIVFILETYCHKFGHHIFVYV